MDKQRIKHLQTMPYEEYLKTPEWAEKRQRVLERDKGCRLCNTQEKLEVHHRTYLRRGNEDLNDLTTLCESCHEHFHEKKSQVDIMASTGEFSKPIEINELRWEEHLLGLLIQHYSLLPYVRGIVAESDFIGTDTRQLYQLLNASPLPQPAPPELSVTVAKATKSLEGMSPKDDAGLVKEALQCAVQIKRTRLLQRNTEITYKIDAAVRSGDMEAVRELSLQLTATQRELRAIYSATHLQG